MTKRRLEIPQDDALTGLSIAMAENDDTIFEDSFNTLHSAGLDNATRTELVLVLGMAVGTVGRLRARIAQLEQDND
jgi:hypothetical protein